MNKAEHDSFLSHLEHEKPALMTVHDKGQKEPEGKNAKSLDEANNNDKLLSFYHTTVTSFGMKRIKEGRLLEKIIWVLAIIVIVSFTSYTLYRNSVRFLAYNVKFETKSVLT